MLTSYESSPHVNIFKDIAMGRLSELAKCIDQKQLPLMNPHSVYKETPLMHAAMYQQLPAFQLLIPHSNPNGVDPEGWSALMYAAHNGFIEGIQELLTVEGLDVNLKHEGGANALVLAALSGHVDCVNLLLEHTLLLDENHQPAFDLALLSPPDASMTAAALKCKAIVLACQEQWTLASATGMVPTRSRPLPSIRLAL